MIDTLQPLSTFCLQTKSYDNFDNAINVLDRIIKYTTLLTRKPQLSDFVACDEDGNIIDPNELAEDNLDMRDIGEGAIADLWIKQYQQAKEKCLFEGFEVNDSKIKSLIWRNKRGDLVVFFNDGRCTNFRTLEDFVPYNLILSPFAKTLIYGT